MTKELKQTLVVTRFGELDTEWLDNLEREQRREALSQYRTQAIHGAARGALKLGKGIIWLLTPEERRPLIEA